MIVTVATYRLTTTDVDTLDTLVSARLEDAVERLADDLDRPIELDERAELMIPLRDGSLCPRATPITAVAAGWTIDGDRLVGCSPIPAAWPWTNTPGPTVTYTGGWVERTANPNATNRLPLCISDDLCWAAWRAGNPTSPADTVSIPRGATSVRLGDAAITFGPNGAPGTSAASAQRWSAKTLRYRYRATRSA